MIIAFCTACMNGRWQLEQTLAANLAALRGTGHLLALCDFNSQDGVGTLVGKQADRMRDGTLLYFRTEEPTAFHAAVAKNTAHRLALRRRPDALFNLDADNFVTPATIRAVEEELGPDVVLHHWSRSWRDGSVGRIALDASRWTELGGYDESLLGMAWQDLDLLMRARAAGLRYRLRDDGVPEPVQNSLEQKLENLRRGEARGVFALNAENFARSMARPLRLSVDEQRRFAGRIDLGEEAVV